MRKILTILLFLCSLSPVLAQRVDVWGDSLRFRARSSGNNISVHFGNDSSAIWYRDANGVERVVTSGTDVVQDTIHLVDTLNGRPVLIMPEYAKSLIPDSHHIVIEPDFIKARSSGNSYFDSLRYGWYHYNLLKDSTELFLPIWDDTTFNQSEVYFTVTFFGSDDDDSLFVHDATSILYFSDTVYCDGAQGVVSSNYMSSDHPISQFRIEPISLFYLVWINDEKRYYLR